jgi:hypothetical protein
MQCREDAAIEPELEPEPDPDPDPATTEGTDLPPPSLS